MLQTVPEREVEARLPNLGKTPADSTAYAWGAGGDDSPGLWAAWMLRSSLHGRIHGVSRGVIAASATPISASLAQEQKIGRLPV